MMKVSVFGLFVFLAALTVLTPQTAAQPGKAKEDAEKKKAEAERKATVDAELKKHYARMEIRGVLSQEPEDSAWGYTTKAWHVTINELKWRLEFGDNKELAAQAARLAGKPVLITGTVMPFKIAPLGGPIEVRAAPQKPVHRPLPVPEPDPYARNKPDRDPTIRLFPVAVPIIVNVESLKAARD